MWVLGSEHYIVALEGRQPDSGSVNLINKERKQQPPVVPGVEHT